MKHYIKLFESWKKHSLKLSDRFNEEEAEILGFLMHDKAHVLGRTGHGNDPTLASIFNKVKGERYRGTLWRGIYREEKELYETLYLTREAATVTRYLSFSESRETAILFSKLTNILIELTDSKGLLNYHQWIREIAEQDLKSGGDEYYYRDLMETADVELEHIMNIGTRIQVIAKRQEDDLTIYTIRQA
jgi:hypothetical protein